MGAIVLKCLRFSLCVLLCELNAVVQAQNLVAVVTDNGRTLAGEIDSRSDKQALWVRRSEDNIVLTTAVAWSEIVSVKLDDKQIESAELLHNVKEIATSGPATFLTEYEQFDRSRKPAESYDSAGRLEIMSVEIDAGLVNLDRTVEPDGLVLALSAVDSHGNYVPVRGTLNARLVVERIDQHRGVVSFEEFQRWSSAVSLADFHDGIAELPLRFRSASPEFDWELCTAALLHVRLGVFGEGNFEASVPVAIHQFNPFRDEMRNQQGSRFFRDELTHNTRHDEPRNLHRGYSAR
jgi:hypothetical protein